MKKNILKLSLVIIILFQIILPLFAHKYTKPYYSAELFATTGIVFNGEDLHKLNEGAHYFGQTMIGWTKFPHFKNNLIKFAGLKEDTEVNMHMQERQNIIITLKSYKDISTDNIEKTYDFFSSEIDKYNKKTNTQFILTNKDYSKSYIKNSYLKAAIFTFLLSLVLLAVIDFLYLEFIQKHN